MKGEDFRAGLTAQEQIDYSRFMKAVKHFNAHRAALVLNALSLGVKYHGCPKGYLARKWATRNRPVIAGRNDIVYKTEKQLEQAVATVQSSFARIGR